MTRTQTLTRLLHAIDTLDWATVRACLADEVRTDYTSLFGGEPTTVSGDDLVAQWQSLLPGFAATHHLTGPVLESDGVVDTHVQAHHWMPDGQRWSVYGRYTAHVVDGRITSLTLHTYQQEGDPELPATAAANPDRRA